MFCLSVKIGIYPASCSKTRLRAIPFPYDEPFKVSGNGGDVIVTSSVYDTEPNASSVISNDGKNDGIHVR